MRPHTRKPNLENTYHRDGAVSYWSVYDQQWHRLQAADIPARELAAMDVGQRRRIALLAQRCSSSE